MEIKEIKLSVTKDYIGTTFKRLVERRIVALRMRLLILIAIICAVMCFTYSVQRSMIYLGICLILLLLGIAIYYDHMSIDSAMLYYCRRLSNDVIYNNLKDHIDILGRAKKSYEHKKLFLIAAAMSNEENVISVFNDSHIILNEHVIIELSNKFYDNNVEIITERYYNIALEVTDNWIRLLEN